MNSDVTDHFYNVGTGKRTSLKELAEKIIAITNCNKEINFKPRSQATLVKNRIGCPEKAKQDIGFVAGSDLDDGLIKLINWRKNELSNLAS